MRKQSLINFPVSLGSFQSFIDNLIDFSYQKKSAMVCVANVHMFIESYKYKEFQKIIYNSNLVAPDGQPLVWALKWLYGIRQERVSGMDLLPALLAKMSKEGISAYFFGGTDIMLDNTRKYLRYKYPDLKIAGFHSPPFGQLNHTVNDKIFEKINSSYPAVVFVILGCPKQEKWMASMKGKINTVMVGIGGALPVMIKMQKRAPKWMQKYGLEWVFRLYQEPRRLFKRYLYTNTLFLWILLKEFVKLKIFKYSRVSNTISKE